MCRWLIDWLIGWLVIHSVSQCIDWLIDWLIAKTDSPDHKPKTKKTQDLIPANVSPRTKLRNFIWLWKNVTTHEVMVDCFSPANDAVEFPISMQSRSVYVSQITTQSTTSSIQTDQNFSDVCRTLFRVKTLQCKNKTSEEPEIKIAYCMMCQQTRFESAKM